MNNTQQINLNVEVSELNVILAALQELPHRVADPILKKLIQQAQAQISEPPVSA